MATPQHARRLVTSAKLGGWQFSGVRRHGKIVPLADLREWVLSALHQAASRQRG